MKKLLCLVFVALFMVACSSDSTDPAPQAPAPASPPAADSVQRPAESTQPSAAQGSVTAAAATADNGSAIYQQSCRSCHDSGIMDAPKFGHDRYSADIDELVENSINGIGRMPARGGNSSLSDADVRAAVEYMVEMSK